MPLSLPLIVDLKNDESTDAVDTDGKIAALRIDYFRESFVRNLNDAKGIIEGQGKDVSWQNIEVKISWPSPMNIQLCCKTQMKKTHAFSIISLFRS